MKMHTSWTISRASTKHNHKTRTN